MKNIVVICGSGVATRVATTDMLQRELKKKGLEVKVQPLSISEIGNSAVMRADLVLLMTRLKNIQTDAPVLSGIPFLTGVGAAELIEKIYGELTKGE